MFVLYNIERERHILDNVCAEKGSTTTRKTALIDWNITRSDVDNYFAFYLASSDGENIFLAV